MITKPMQESYESQFGMMRIVLVVGFFIVAYMLYNLTVSIYENYNLEKHIADFEDRNTKLQDENAKKQDDLAYYISEEYIDKIAKQNLNLVNPGEKVIVIPDEDLVVISNDPNASELSEDIMNSWPNSKKWWEFFFGSNQFKS
ncbi:MAG: septum formation initiator family protein [Candidatus Gracilibacteria bacterium]